MGADRAASGADAQASGSKPTFIVVEEKGKGIVFDGVSSILDTQAVSRKWQRATSQRTAATFQLQQRSPKKVFSILCRRLGLKPRQLRHATQMFIAILIGCIIHTIGPLAKIMDHKGAWAVITTSLVVEPNFGASVRKSGLRVAGTIMGGSYGAVILALAQLCYPEWDYYETSVRKAVIPVLGLSLWCAFCHYRRFSDSNKDYMYAVMMLTSALVIIGGYYDKGILDSWENQEAGDWLARIGCVILGVFIGSTTAALVTPVYAGKLCRECVQESVDNLSVMLQCTTHFYTVDEDGDGILDGNTGEDADGDGIDDGIAGALSRVRSLEARVVTNLEKANVLNKQAKSEWYFTEPHTFECKKYMNVVARLRILFNITVGLLFPVENGSLHISLCVQEEKKIKALVSTCVLALSNFVRLVQGKMTFESCLDALVDMQLAIDALERSSKMTDPTKAFAHPHVEAYISLCLGLETFARQLLLAYASLEEKNANKIIHALRHAARAISMGGHGQNASAEHKKQAYQGAFQPQRTLDALERLASKIAHKGMAGVASHEEQIYENSGQQQFGRMRE